MDAAYRQLLALRPDSGTGPDDAPSLILRTYARELATPIAVLTVRILASMEWPAVWREHWIVPLYKRCAVFLAKNYRGVHLTSQISKVIERLIMLEPYLEKTVSFGENQFAYRTERGSRNVLALLMLQWMTILNSREKVSIYCNDVSGAFDRMSLDRLVEKLRAKGVNERV